MMLIYQLNGDACRFGLVGDVLAQLAVTPGAHFLLTFGVQLFPIGHVAYIPQCQRAYLPLNRLVHHRPADLMLNVGRPTALLGQKAVLAPLELLPLTRAFLPTRLRRLNLGQSLIRVLAYRSKRTSG